ncbi:hypothetical protein Pan181_42150 [Aeoliella mucimassa]|uniref:Uncharacterized protein n=1 Tax=Aeoliella mucimassa TaxID=2527972 RepID=A0A518ATD0_9BACT|nr:hypothetical protein Pan181_42150 [Aeoliella mucimassa]
MPDAETNASLRRPTIVPVLIYRGTVEENITETARDGVLSMLRFVAVMREKAGCSSRLLLFGLREELIHCLIYRIIHGFFGCIAY